jgi:hypothetical protein
LTEFNLINNIPDNNIILIDNNNPLFLMLYTNIINEYYDINLKNIKSVVLNNHIKQLLYFKKLYMVFPEYYTDPNKFKLEIDLSKRSLGLLINQLTLNPSQYDQKELYELIQKGQPFSQPIYRIYISPDEKDKYLDCNSIWGGIHIMLTGAESDPLFTFADIDRILYNLSQAGQNDWTPENINKQNNFINISSSNQTDSLNIAASLLHYRLGIQNIKGPNHGAKDPWHITLANLNSAVCTDFYNDLKSGKIKKWNYWIVSEEPPQKTQNWLVSYPVKNIPVNAQGKVMIDDLTPPLHPNQPLSQEQQNKLKLLAQFNDKIKLSVNNININNPELTQVLNYLKSL